MAVRPGRPKTGAGPGPTPGTFRIFEEWESQAALDAHFRMPHMAAFAAAVAKLGVKEMAVQRYEVSSVKPLRS